MNTRDPRTTNSCLQAAAPLAPLAGGGSRSHEVLLPTPYERKPSLQPHLADVSQPAVALDCRLGHGETVLGQLHRATQLHDIGRIAVPDAILRTPGSLDEDDWRLVSRHTGIGERILGARPPSARSARSFAPCTSAGTAAATRTVTRVTRFRCRARIVAAATRSTR